MRISGSVAVDGERTAWEAEGIEGISQMDPEAAGVSSSLPVSFLTSLLRGHKGKRET